MCPDEKSCNLVSATGIFVYTSPDGTKENVFPVRSGNGWEWFTINSGANSGGSPFKTVLAENKRIQYSKQHFQ